jgi:hypothetical protein
LRGYSMPQKTAYAVKLPEDVTRRVREYCLRKGLKQGHFVAEALREKMEREEEMEDLRDLATLRNEEGKAVPYRAYARKRLK